jgi:hypothetical protein
MDKKNYDSIGRCIYCLGYFSPSELTDEHIVPLALNGTLIMKKAACDPCRDHTNKQFENDALQADFLVPRLLLELKRRKKSKPKKLPAANIILHDDTEIRDIALELSQYPPIAHFFVFDPAGRLIGQEKTGDLDSFRIIDIHLPQPQNVFYRRVETNHKQDFTSFAMTLAKIAYCFAVAEKRVGLF